MRKLEMLQYNDNQDNHVNTIMLMMIKKSDEGRRLKKSKPKSS
jgi:hypothetical protein